MRSTMNSFPAPQSSQEHNPFVAANYAGGAYDAASAVSPFAPQQSFNAPAAPYIPGNYQPTPAPVANWAPVASPFVDTAPSADRSPFTGQPVANTFNAIPGSPFSAGAASNAEAGQWWTPQEAPLSNYQESALGDRLRNKARAVFAMAKNALSSFGINAPSLNGRVKDAYNSDYGQKIAGMAKGAAGETFKAGALGGAQALGERYGLGFENGRVSIASKKALAKGAFRLMRAPQAEALGAVRAAGVGAYSGVRQEGVNQFNTAKSTLGTDARGYVQNKFAT